MKTKLFLCGGLSLGLIAGVLRIVQYFTCIDELGFYQTGGPASFLTGCLVGILLVGCAWSILSSRKLKEQVPANTALPRVPANLIFGGLATLSIAMGIFRIFLATTQTDPDFHLPHAIGDIPSIFSKPAVDWPGMLVSVLCLLGASGWIVLCFRRETGFSILPTLQVGALIIDYFWATYQYIHISAYILMVFSLCAVLLYCASLAKLSVGASCSRGRLTGVSVLLLCLVPASIIESFIHPTLPNLMLLILNLLLFALAVITLLQLSKPQAKLEDETLSDMPDPAVLNRYFSEIPEEEQNHEENR